MTFSRDGDDYVVVGSKSGEPEDPAWFTNLVANPIVTVETDGETFQARATVAEGADRDALWDRHVAEHQAVRRIPFEDRPSHPDRPAHATRLTGSKMTSPDKEKQPTGRRQPTSFRLP